MQCRYDMRINVGLRSAIFPKVWHKHRSSHFGGYIFDNDNRVPWGCSKRRKCVFDTRQVDLGGTAIKNAGYMLCEGSTRESIRQVLRTTDNNAKKLWPSTYARRGCRFQILVQLMLNGTTQLLMYDFSLEWNGCWDNQEALHFAPKWTVLDNNALAR